MLVYNNNKIKYVYKIREFNNRYKLDGGIYEGNYFYLFNNFNRKIEMSLNL